jgi:hypothetical protein
MKKDDFLQIYFLSLENLKKTNFDYYKEIIEDTKKINFRPEYNNIYEFNRDLFFTTHRDYFTISSKESFNLLEHGNKFQNSLIFTPLNDHSRIYMKRGDVVFCYRQGQFGSLDDALNTRGIYGLGIVASDPKELFKDKIGYERYGVEVVFPFPMQNLLELRNIQLNPNTINLTPYNGNRNDALQHIESDIHYESLLEMIVRKNNNLKEPLEIFLNKKFVDKKLPTEFWLDNEKEVNPEDRKINASVASSSQIIYYGVPGCGKSYKIDKDTQSLPEDQKSRIVFHPDYTNADFVGQILPKTTSTGLKYEFIPGPFSIMLWRALKNLDKSYYLIIEEINRGNASAIFGDVFQLLDRDGNGWSHYFIENEFLNSYIRNQYEYKNNKYDDTVVQDSITLQDGKIISANTGIRLPPNLSLLATMNTSDQNVFTLDNAFQRRWEMKLVDDYLEDTNPQYNALIAETGMYWGDFRNQINTIIASGSEENGLSSMEDKRLGSWFIKPADGSNTISAERFAAKVLKYLWDDAFKFNRTELFSREYRTFDEVYKAFVDGKKGMSIFLSGKINEHTQS